MKPTRNIPKKFLLLLFLLVAVLQTNANEIRFKSIKNIEWKAVISEARRLHKPIFLDFYTEWCGSCKRMDKLVLQDPGVAWKFNQNFVNVKVDAENFDGIELSQKYDVRCFPTYVFIDEDGKILYKSEGMASVSTFIGFANDALEVFNWRGTPKTNEKLKIEKVIPEKEEIKIKYPSVVKKTIPEKKKPKTKKISAKKAAKQKKGNKKKVNAKKIKKKYNKRIKTVARKNKKSKLAGTKKRPR
jgi:thiol-disulfide isomerase/thioredoxin